MTNWKMSPYLVIILGFSGIIIIGTMLLLLPIATKEGFNLSYIDALFTSTSAVCVTGLLSLPSVDAVYTTFGKIVLVLLMEIGGLGFVTTAIFLFTLLGLKIGIQDRFLIKESLNQNSLRGMVRLVRFAVITTLIIQSIGALINFTVFINHFSFWNAIGVSIFHAISAFNNAGLDIFPEGQSMIPFYDNVLLNINSSILIIIGGIGFIVIYDIITKKSIKKLSIHSRIVLKTSLALIIIGMILLKFIEGDNITWMQAYFSSVSARTAGFATVDFNMLSNTALIIIILLMYIGASPASTGGGIKTTTFFTTMKYIGSFASGKQAIAYKRRISDSSIYKAFILIAFSLVYISFIIFMITYIETYNPQVTDDQYTYFTKIVFEVFSAFGTVGYSMGITQNLHQISKFILVITMILGRLGPITVISVWNKKWNVNVNTDIKYLEERIIIG